MCGIVGYSNLSRRLPQGLLASAVNALIHRGPDQQGRFDSDVISLGVVRLRILDMVGGDQPFTSRDRNVVVTFNGEIFNHREIRQQLEERGYAFETFCDTEVILNAFLEWGEACFARFRGMFGVAVWVQSERRLLLARDRMGIKPLYYHLQGKDIYFGSELKCILLHPEVPRKIDATGLSCFLSLNWVPGPYTLVEGIRKLMPGHLLQWLDGQTTIDPYTTPQSDGRAPCSLHDAVEELDVLLQDAIEEQLVSDVPVGIWLSGGIDSSTVLHYAAQKHTEPLHTFSITFSGKSFDESHYVREISSYYGARLHEFDLNPNAELAHVIEQLAYYSDEPGADAGALPTWYLARMTRDHATAVLTGEGADELFAGYLTYKADRYHKLAAWTPSWLKRTASVCAEKLPVSDEKIGFDYKVKRFLAGSLLSADAAHLFWNGTFSEREKRSLLRACDSSGFADLLGKMEGSGLSRYLDFDQRYYLPDDILYKVDRMSMAHSLEVRPPFLAPEIVDFSRRLPDRFKLSGTTSKVVLRTLMKDKLPLSVLQRPKIGFDIPVHEWFRGVLRPLLLDVLSRDNVEASGLFHWPSVHRLINDHLERRANVGYHLWGLVILILWMKRWKIEAGPRKAMEAVHAFDEI